MRDRASVIAVWRNLFAGLLCAAAVCVSAVTGWAETAPFDLQGPKLVVTVTRNGVTLPISQVPNLAVGDQVSIKADLPDGQAAHYLMVLAFLRGATNPPPENWFYRSETWNRKDKNGLTVTVPDGAEQVIVFLAPETGGDFKTLMNAVRGKPGAFVRASQDLNQASLDRARLDAYLAVVRQLNSTDPGKLKDAVPVLGRSLAMKVDKECFDKLTEQQAPCLLQDQDALVLNDGHSASIVDMLTSGPSADLAMQASFAPQANYGYSSSYVASVMDIARIMDYFHTAQYQYIPALARLQQDRMALLLNAPPSFHNPKSVLVVALPPVEPPSPPPLQAVNAKQTYCVGKPGLVLGVDGAPLVFSTDYAHGLELRVEAKDVTIPVRADALGGGLVVESRGMRLEELSNPVDATLQGYWGFDRYDGPTFRLGNAQTQTWELAAADKDALVVGREDTVHLVSKDACCVDAVTLKDSAGKEEKLEWKATKPTEIEVKLPLKEQKPGALSLEVTEFGGGAPKAVALTGFAEAGRMESFTIHAGDTQGVLKGQRLDEAASLKLNGTEFVPGKMTTAMGSDSLVMETKDAKAAAGLKPGQVAKATIELKDGRSVPLNVTVATERPSVELIGKNISFAGGTVAGGAVGGDTDGAGTTAASGNENNIQLSNPDELPLDAKLTFSVRAKTPAQFSRDEKIEVATEDESYTALLTEANGLTLGDRKVAVATLNPAKDLGESAFGPLRFRVMDGDVPGEWQPLATLVRLPQLRTLKCPAAADAPCQLAGGNLYLVDSVSGDANFEHAVEVPDGFPGSVLAVPHPVNGALYVKLRDDPAVVNQMTLTAETVSVAKPKSAAAKPEAAQTAAAATPTTPQSAAQPVSVSGSASGSTGSGTSGGGESGPRPRAE
jgi:hypothetical protein